MSIIGSRYLFIRYATNAGGSPYLNVDGSSEPVEYKVDVPEGHRLELTSMNLVLGFPVLETGKIQMSKFGNLDALTNGISFEISYSGRLVDTTVGYPWKTNTDLLIPSMLCDPLTTYQLDGDAILIYRYPLAPSQTYTAIELASGDFFRFMIRDDLSNLDCFRITLFGILIPDSLA